MMQKPSNARGTRDFGPKEMVKRNYVFSIIKKHFERFGFQNIETPSIESIKNISLLFSVHLNFIELIYSINKYN